MKRLLATLAALATAAALLGAVLVWFGVYNIAATEQHLAPTYWLLDTAMRRSIIQRAAHIEAPRLDAPKQRARGLVLFREHCVQCHGAPGVAPESFALGMTPAAANLVHTALVWPSAELFWAIKHGIKMTGMPAWAFRLSDADTWAVVAFLKVLPTLSPEQYAALGEAARIAPLAAASTAAVATNQPDPQRGKIAIQQYACVTCHMIPGIVGSNAPVGPPLDAFGRRSLISGVLPNQPDNLMEWLRAPQTISPHSAMPDLGVNERDARDIAAYLHTLR